jgi:formylmethanofuran dehydrogenase subunit B
VKKTDASYRVSYHIAVVGETNTFAETPIKLHEVKMAICVLDEEQKKKFETVHLSNNTVKSHSRFVSRYRKVFGVPIYISLYFFVAT